MSRYWNRLPESLQLALARAALTCAVETIAEQAETLASEMEEGRLADRGGPEALRLLASVARVTERDARTKPLTASAIKLTHAPDLSLPREAVP